MQLLFTTFDVFTQTAFLGNPLAIIRVPRSADLPQHVKQSIAREFNLSEIVFLQEQNADDVEKQQVRINIFTAYAEISFAGHPTIGTAYFLLQHLQNETVNALVTKAGQKPIKKVGDGVQIGLAHNVRIHDSPFKDEEFGHFPVVSPVKGMTFILAKQDSLEALGEHSDNLLGFKNCYAESSRNKLDEGWREGPVISFYYFDLGLDERGVRNLRTRSFGAREDPGTGSASAALTSYLSLTEQDGGLVRKYHLTQGVEMGRQCDIFVEVTLKEDGTGIESVLLSGTAVKTMEGFVEVPDSVL